MFDSSGLIYPVRHARLRGFLLPPSKFNRPLAQPIFRVVASRAILLFLHQIFVSRLAQAYGQSRLVVASVLRFEEGHGLIKAGFAANLLSHAQHLAEPTPICKPNLGQK